MKDKDLFVRTQYLSMYVRVLPVSLFFGIIAWVVYGWWAFCLAMIVGLLFPLPAMYATGRIADLFLFCYSGGSGQSTLKDELAGDVEKIRILRRERHFEEAFELAEVLLTKDPKHAEVLFLKAQLLYEPFAQYSSASACLNKILAMDPPPRDELVQWATTLREEIQERIRERASFNG
ncbi:MAG: hypothetical protein Q3M24_09340 [Candidatus Electrothrix aestuarii]|uniref:Tetratricopeptide repeat-containing protein n=1 Tax=Candidatus Electrothrix aestuarii TaxID=3062594 RepID=A0AAU8M074_9BACT|nr:hypothetical protein [Candidatus Electrothrix aestuarii]